MSQITDIVLSPRFKDFVNSHINDDVSRLRLKYHNSDEAEFYALAITQIECRHKYASKLNETLAACENFIFPDTLAGEQSTSDSLSRFHTRLVLPTTSVVDFTAGLGIDVLHLAKAGVTVTACELNELRAEILSVNSQSYGVSDCLTVIHTDSVKALNEGKLTAQTAFIDPARRASDGSRVFSIGDCEPDVLNILKNLSEHFERLIIKLSPMLDISATAAAMPGITDIYCLGTATECKELVVVIDLKNPYINDRPTLHAVTLFKDTEQAMSFTARDERTAEVSYITPTVGDTLLIPYPAVIKSGAFKSVAVTYKLTKVAPNTHLYLLPDNEDIDVHRLPGHIHKISEVVVWQSKNIKRLKKQYPKAWVTTKNFGMSADALQSKLNIKPGGDTRIIAITDGNGSKLLLVTK